MAIPDFQTLMLPLLRHLADGAEHNNQDTVDALATQFNLTDAERAQLLPSGKQTVFRNRVAWAKSHGGSWGFVLFSHKRYRTIAREGLAEEISQTQIQDAEPERKFEMPS